MPTTSTIIAVTADRVESARRPHPRQVPSLPASRPTDPQNPKHTVNSDFSIIAHYQAEFRGIVGNDQFAFNLPASAD